VIPGHQIHVGIDDADALRDVFHRRGEQLAAEAQFLRSLVQYFRDLVDVEPLAPERVGQDDASRRCADGACQRAFDVLQHAPVGGIGWFGRRARRLSGIFVERSACRGMADDTAGHSLEVAHFGGDRGQPQHGPLGCGKYARGPPFLQGNALEQ
jgi:hypothetical protein